MATVPVDERILIRLQIQRLQQQYATAAARVNLRQARGIDDAITRRAIQQRDRIGAELQERQARLRLLLAQPLPAPRVVPLPTATEEEEIEQQSEPMMISPVYIRPTAAPTFAPAPTAPPLQPRQFRQADSARLFARLAAQYGVGTAKPQFPFDRWTRTEGVCDLSVFQSGSIRVFPPGETASLTVQFVASVDPSTTITAFQDYIARFGSTRVFSKIYFDRRTLAQVAQAGDDLTFNGQDYDDRKRIEVTITDYMDRLSRLGFLGNIMRLVGYFGCDWDSLGDEGGLKAAIEDRLKPTPPIPPSKMPGPPVLGTNKVRSLYMIVTEAGQGQPLEAIFSNNITLSVADMRSILAQLTYTLHVFSDLGIRHNDLHLGNVWINSTSAPDDEYAVYFVTDNSYIVTRRKYWVKIIDYDLATWTVPQISGSIDFPLNQYLDKEFCPMYGICDDSNRKFDIFTPAFLIAKDVLGYQGRSRYPRYFNYPGGSGAKAVLQQWINTVIPDKKMFGFTSTGRQTCCVFNGRLCKYDDATGKCLPLTTDDPFLSGVSTPFNVFRSGYFSRGLTRVRNYPSFNMVFLRKLRQAVLDKFGVAAFPQAGFGTDMEKLFGDRLFTGPRCTYSTGEMYNKLLLSYDLAQGRYLSLDAIRYAEALQMELRPMVDVAWNEKD